MTSIWVACLFRTGGRLVPFLLSVGPFTQGTDGFSYAEIMQGYYRPKVESQCMPHMQHELDQCDAMYAQCAVGVSGGSPAVGNINQVSWTCAPECLLLSPSQNSSRLWIWDGLRTTLDSQSGAKTIVVELQRLRATRVASASYLLEPGQVMQGRYCWQSLADTGLLTIPSDNNKLSWAPQTTPCLCECGFC